MFNKYWCSCFSLPLSEMVNEEKRSIKSLFMNSCTVLAQSALLFSFTRGSTKETIFFFFRVQHSFCFDDSSFISEVLWKKSCIDIEAEIFSLSLCVSWILINKISSPHFHRFVLHNIPIEKEIRLPHLIDDQAKEMKRRRMDLFIGSTLLIYVLTFRSSFESMMFNDPDHSLHFRLIRLFIAQRFLLVSHILWITQLKRIHGH